MAPAAWDADILPKCMRKATMQRISRAWAQRPRETGLRNVLMWGRASWKIIAGSLRPRVGDSGRLDTSMIAEPAGRSEPSLQLKKSATSELALRVGVPRSAHPGGGERGVSIFLLTPSRRPTKSPPGRRNADGFRPVAAEAVRARAAG